MIRPLARAARLASVATLLAFAGLAATPATSQVGYKTDPQGKDELWEVTSKMEMPGMPMQMPAQTRRICAEKGSDTGMIPRNEGCTVAESKRAGNKLTYRMTCKEGNSDYTATGESTWSGNSFEGRMLMSGKMQGQPMDMTMTYTGTRAGNCTVASR